nr:immunoglobulin heavy chain junction region [Mus musculus]
FCARDYGSTNLDY